MRVEDYEKYMNLLHELALIEDEIRDFAAIGSTWAARILFERFNHE